MEAPLQDPYASPMLRAPRRRSRLERALMVVLLVAALVAAVFVGAFIVAPRLSAAPPASTMVARESPVFLTSIRNMARLETIDAHVERVVDLTDKQSRFFGLVEATDALLLVAVGHVSIGVDLSRLSDGDVALDPATGDVRVTLPAPEVFSVRLDEGGTYVYTRATSLLARRNEHLEARARQEAIRAIEKAALEGDVMERARAQAERVVSTLATQLGAKRVEIRFRPAPGGG